MLGIQPCVCLSHLPKGFIAYPQYYQSDPKMIIWSQLLIIIGFAMAVPVGPIGIMCIRKTLTEGRLRGLMIGLGAATADLIYGCIAAFGLTVISSAIETERTWMQLVGGALLLFLGVKTFCAFPVDPKVPANRSGMLGSYLYAVFLTLINPTTIFAFIAVFAALARVYHPRVRNLGLDQS